MKKRLKQILKRDNYICGVHTGGCKKIINPNKDNPTLDHIFPRSYIKNNKNKDKFRKSWNYQPMCGLCNDKRGGQLINAPIFTCKCHYIYIESNGDWFIFYKFKNKWESFCYTTVDSGAQMVVGKRGNKVGWSSVQNNKFGHLIYSYRLFKRVLINANQLFRVGQFKKVIEECNIFKKYYLRDGGISLMQETGNKKILTLSEFYFLQIVSLLYFREGPKKGSLYLGKDFFGNQVFIETQLRERILDLDKDDFKLILNSLLEQIDKYISYLLENNFLIYKNASI